MDSNPHLISNALKFVRNQNILSQALEHVENAVNTNVLYVTCLTINQPHQ